MSLGLHGHSQAGIGHMNIMLAIYPHMALGWPLLGVQSDAWRVFDQ